ncbi:MAG: hypothetical protein E7Z93_02805 [Cyanobacteria bacterium SIG32]|nr:hypothetical protein [Cyanobacteria bacterium SIG32]
MFKKLAEQIRTYSEKKSNTLRVTSPLAGEFLTSKNEYYRKISQKAVELYEKQSDINHFSKLVLSNPENTDCNEMVNKLFEDGVTDPFVDEKLANLADNQKFLKDLGLL